MSPVHEYDIFEFSDIPLPKKGDMFYSEKHCILVKRSRKYGMTCQAFDRTNGNKVNKFDMSWDYFAHYYKRGKFTLSNGDHFEDGLFEI